MGNIVMNSYKLSVLFMLLYFQLSGIIISLFLVYISKCENIRRGHLFTHRVIKLKRENTQSLIDYFQKHPRKVFKEIYPDIYRLAMATKKYKRINLLRDKGLLTDRQYERNLEKILPQVDISSELRLAGLNS